MSAKDHASHPPSALPPVSTITQPFDSPAATLDHFRSIPWANSLLSSPDYYPIQTWSRTSKSTGEDAFFADTLGTASTIPHCLTLRRRHIPAVPREPPTLGSSSSTKPATPKAPSHPPDLIMLLALSNPGISGHPSTAHGGAVATILDEALSLAVALHVPAYDANEAERRGQLYTAQLDVRYRKPVSVPGLLVVKAWGIARNGRKYWMRGQVLQEEDDDNGGHLEWMKRKTVRAEALGFWLETAGKL